MKLLHLITDDKFVDSHIDKFRLPGVDNVYVYLKETPTYSGKNASVLLHTSPQLKNCQKILSEVEKYDAVVTNGLNYFQSVFINQLSNKIKVFWCFFGAEIYNNPRIWRQEQLYGPETLMLLKRNRFYFFLRSIYHLRFFVKDGRHPNIEIKKAIGRCDYFLWYSREEYDMIQKHVRIKLPPFKYLSIINREADLSVKYSKRDQMLVGNSGSEMNNHADVFKLINGSPCEFDIKVPVSYGLKRWYRKEITKVLSSSKNMRITLIEDFVPYQHYKANFEDSKAAVYPSYRQMGLGNIILCILHGVKLYLSVKNPIFHWLKNAGIAVFSIEDNLPCDLRKNDLEIDLEIINRNKAAWNTLNKKRNQTDFFDMLRLCVDNLIEGSPSNSSEYGKDR